MTGLLSAVWRALAVWAEVVVNGSIILEIKAVASLLPAYESQILTYLHTSGISVGLLMNFHARLLKDGLLRFVV